MDNRAITAPGELISANGTNFHVRRWGDRGPVILLECGLTMMSSCWGWLAPELATFAQIIGYDRAGLGWSDHREGVRDVCAVACELDELLNRIGTTTPLLLAGHSMGAMFNRAFAEIRPEKVRAMVWLDPAHPEQIQRRGIRRRMKNLIFYIQAAQLLAAKGVPAIEVPLIRHLETLPIEDFRALRRFFRNPTHLRTCAREARAWEESIKSLPKRLEKPLLILSARKNALPGWEGLQAELAALSSKSKQTSFGEVSHISMLACREHACKMAHEIHGFVHALGL